MIHFLLVDDEQPLIKAIAKRLRQRQYTADCVYSGQAALDFLEEHEEVDVVVLDVKMPGLDGIATLEAIKKKHPLVEVVMLTGHATVPSAVDAIKAGAFDYVTKPCDLDELIDKAFQANSRKKDREGKIFNIRTTPYISDKEREEKINKILSS